MTTTPTDEFLLQHDGWTAVVTRVGAGLRAFRAADVDLVTTFPAGTAATGCRGQHLLPWPNRVRDGRWQLDGAAHQLEITEAERHNAIHGLVRDLPFDPMLVADDRVRLVTTLAPQPGWPGTLRIEIEHRLDASGLTVEVLVRNIGEVLVPVGYGAHPYLRLASGSLDEWTLEVPFSRWLGTDERLLPVALHPCQGSDVALDAARPVGGRSFDTAFTDPTSTEGWTIALWHGDERLELWGDASLGWVQLYAPPERDCIAIEPMSVGPDAFNPGPTHDDLPLLVPGGELVHRWGIRG